jgi:hypothetical protein
MPREKKFAAEPIIGKLREAEVGLAQGKTVPETASMQRGRAETIASEVVAARGWSGTVPTGCHRAATK